MDASARATAAHGCRSEAVSVRGAGRAVSALLSLPSQRESSDTVNLPTPCDPDITDVGKNLGNCSEFRSENATFSGNEAGLGISVC